MKKYTSPAVNGSQGNKSYIMPALLKSVAISSVAVDGGPSPSFVSKILGDDFTSLRVDSLVPCLES